MPFYSETYHQGFVDEFRLWIGVRSQVQIIEYMNKKLIGNEKNLHVYYDFNDIDRVGEPRVAGDARVSLDLTGKGNHLYFGGCATCGVVDGYDFRGFMAYDPAHGVFPPANVTRDGDPRGAGYAVCIPNAKTFDSPSLTIGLTWGASAHCFGTMEQSDSSTYPTRTISGALLGGFEFIQLAEHNQVVTILLNATDPDSTTEDQLRFRIRSIPEHCKVWYGSNADSSADRTLITPSRLPLLLPTYVRAIVLQPDLGVGGAPFGQIIYSVTDGLEESTNSSIPIYVECTKGTYIDSLTKKCLPCAIGTVQPDRHLHVDSCLPCARHYYQDKAGQLQCKRCEHGTTYQPLTGQSACLKCADLTPNQSLTSLSSSSSLVVNDYNCRTHVSRDDLQSAAIDSSSSSSSSSSSPIYMDLLAQVPSLGLFQDVDEILATYITSLPQVGGLFQAQETSWNGEMDSSKMSESQPRSKFSSLDHRSLAVSSEHLTIGESLREPFYTIATPFSQFITVIFPVGAGEATASRSGHPTSALLGEPDVSRYGTSPLAWSPAVDTNGRSEVFIIFQVAQPVFVQSLTFYETLNPNALVRIEAYNNLTSTWSTLWYLSKTDRLTRSLKTSQVSNMIQQTTPVNSCPSLFLADTLRVTWSQGLVGGPIEVDAISVNGVYKRSQIGASWIENGTIVYTPVSTDVIPINIAYEDSFSYVVRDCSSSPTIFKSSISFAFAGGRFPILHPTMELQKLVYVLSGVAFIAILFVLGVVVMYRSSIIIRSANFPFCIAILMFHFLLPLGSIFYALEPNMVYVCELRSWCTSVAIVGILATLVTKTNLLRAIFLNPKLTQRIITMRSLTLMVGSLVGVQVVLLLIMSAIPLQSPTLGEGIGKGARHLVWQCHAQSSSSNPDALGFSIWLGFVMAYVGGFLLTVAYLCWQVRSIPAAFNESAHIGNCAFAMIFFLLVLVPLQFLVDGDIDALVLIRGVGQNFAALVFLLALFGPKLYYIAIGRANDKSMQLANATRHDGATVGGSSSEVPSKHVMAGSSGKRGSVSRGANMTKVATEQPEALSHKSVKIALPSQSSATHGPAYRLTVSKRRDGSLSTQTAERDLVQLGSPSAVHVIEPSSTTSSTTLNVSLPTLKSNISVEAVNDETREPDPKIASDLPPNESTTNPVPVDTTDKNLNTTQ